MAMLSNQTGKVTATSDENADGRVDKRDDRLAAERVAAGDPAVSTAPVATAAPVVSTPTVDDDVPARPRLAERTASASSVADEPVVVESRGPRPRASLMATLSLVLGVVAALTVLTGVLAGPGVALGVIAAFLGIAGLSATSRRHVAGKADAFLGLALGLGAVVVGILALTGLLPWLSADVDQVTRVHDFLAARMTWLFP